MKGIAFRSQLVFIFDGRAVLELPRTSGRFIFLSLNPELIELFFGSRDEDGWRLRQYPRLLEEGCRGFVLAEGDRWAAVQWIATPESAPPPQIPRRVARGRYWCFNEHTHEDFRRKGLWVQLKRSAFQRMQSDDPNFLSNVYSDTEATNTASRQAHKSFGFVPAGILKSAVLRIPTLGQWTEGVWYHDRAHPSMPMKE